MDGNLTPLPGYSLSSPARILIAEYDSSMLDSMRALNDNTLEIDVDLCTSRDHALRKLLASPYNLIISGVYLAELDDFLLVKQCRAHQSSVPFIVTAKKSDTESARQALIRGAFDVISNPLNPEQSRASVRLALWQNKLLQFLASKEQAIEQIHRHIAKYPADKTMDDVFNRSLLSMGKTFASYQKTVQRVEESIKRFADIASAVEHQTRKRALEHLNPPSK